MTRQSNFWIPSSVTAPVKKGDFDIHSRLVRYGFLRQTHAGIFHMLPLGHRVQWKLETLVDERMASLGACRANLSSLSAERLWEQSGRLSKISSELFYLADRRGSPYILAPTHEEEITALVASCLNSYKELPLRIYQISRKYRDEMRPRAGMLRAREFTMKDLYTFDYSATAALDCYRVVNEAYRDIFNHLHLPVVVVEGNPGYMGGNISHEYLLPSPSGEDELATCPGCGFVANMENVNAIKPEAPSTSTSDGLSSALCPACNKEPLSIQRAIELGHTFYLGTRYSQVLDACVQVPSSLLGGGDAGKSVTVPLEMGCHGIGVTRLLVAAAEYSTNSSGGRGTAAGGIAWPAAIAPFQLVVVNLPGLEDAAASIATQLASEFSSIDILLDDRPESLPWKMQDADNIGYPITVVVGKHWKAKREVEVQCARLSVRSVHDQSSLPHVILRLKEELHI